MALQGFDEAYYLGVKLAALQTTSPEWVGKTTADLKTVLTSAGLTPSMHYERYGYKEGLAPNAFFDATEYKLAKANQMYAAGGYASAEAALADFNAKWTGNAYEHYVQYGYKENVNPSNDFDDSSYYAAKLAKLQADPATSAAWTGKTAADVQAAFGKMSALSHYIWYGIKEGLAPVAVPAGEAVIPPDPADGTTFTLTNATDIASANMFVAPKGFTPGENDQVNTLSDDDMLTGVGTNPTLDFTFVNDADTGDIDIMPTLTGIETIKVKVALDGNGTLDLQDSKGVKNIEISRLDDGNNITIDNITETATNNLTISNSQAPDGTIDFTYIGSALSLDNDVVNVKLDNVSLIRLSVEQNLAIPAEGFETFNLETTGANPNVLGTLQAEDVKTLNIKGDQDLSIFRTFEVTDNISGSTLVEAMSVGGGLVHMAGSLTKIDASAMTGDLSLNLNNILTATQDGTSGTDIAVTVIGSKGNDTFWIGNGVGANDTIDGGTGGNTAILVGGGIAGVISNTQTLEIRTDASFVTVDTSKITQLTDVLVRNEGNTGDMDADGEKGLNDYISVATPVVVTLNKVTDDVAQNGINILHGTTYNNALTDLTLNVDLATDGTADGVVYTIAEGVNSDSRFNFIVTSTDFEFVTIEDKDTESNTVQLVNRPLDTLVITGGEAGDFLNLDYTAGAEAASISAASLNDRGVYGYDVSDNNIDDQTDNGDDDILEDTSATSRQVYTTVDNYGAGPAAEAFATKNIDASAQTSDLIIRVGSMEGQTIKLGTGNDTVVFDASNDRVGDLSTEYAHAGLTNSDTVTGGTGIDTIVVDGESGTAITLQQSEWQNVSGIDQVYVASNNGSSVYNLGNGFTYNYRLDITDDLIDSTDNGKNIVVRNDIDRDDTVFAHETAGTRNAMLLLDLTNIDDKENTVTYNGAEGAVSAAVRVIFDDASINGLSTLDGGDTDVTDKGLGNDNIIEVQNSATVTIADLDKLTNFNRMEYINTTSEQTSLNLDLSDARLDALADSNHAATALEREAFSVDVFDSKSAGSALVINTTNVAGNYDITINTAAGTQVAADDDSFRIGVSSATDYTVNAGTGDDSLELFGTAPGFIVKSTSAFSFSMQYLDVLGNVTGVVSDFANVETLDLRNYTDSQGGAGTGLLVDGNLGATAIVSLDGFTVGGSQNNDTISLGAGVQVVSGYAGADVFVINSDSGNDIITDFGNGADTLMIKGDTVSASQAAVQAAVTALAAGASESDIYAAMAGANGVGGVAFATVINGIDADTYVMYGNGSIIKLDGISAFTVAPDAAGNVVGSTSGGVTPPTPGDIPVTVSAGNTTATDASTGNYVFNIAAGNYEYSVSKFGAGDKIHLPVAQTSNMSLDQTSFTDGSVDIIWAQDPTHIITVHLMGITSAQDAALGNNINNMNTVFGVGTLTFA